MDLKIIEMNLYGFFKPYSCLDVNLFICVIVFSDIRSKNQNQLQNSNKLKYMSPTELYCFDVFSGINNISDTHKSGIPFRMAAINNVTNFFCVVMFF